MLKNHSLSPKIQKVVGDKGTEAPFSGKYESYDHSGTYLCRRCGAALYQSKDKFHSDCGWPSFDEAIPNAILTLPDADGRRTEIVCAHCHAHLGHVFSGEQFTTKNLRYCVNSLSLDFVDKENVHQTEEAIFAAGCFWGVEYYFKQLPGVLKTEVGFSGGDKINPSYEAVCQKDTGHFEVVRVLFDPRMISYETLVKFFFEIHDPTQTDGQGPDKGEQYLSGIFYYDNQQKQIAENVIHLLEAQGLTLATRLRPVSTFWPAADYHQDYYRKTGKVPYCHSRVKRF